MRRGLHPAGVVPCTDSPRASHNSAARQKLAILGISINRIPAPKPRKMKNLDAIVILVAKSNGAATILSCQGVQQHAKTQKEACNGFFRSPATLCREVGDARQRQSVLISSALGHEERNG